MRTHHAITRMSIERVAMRPIMDRMAGACENITFPCGRCCIISQLRKRAMQSSSMCWQQFTVSPTGSEWLKDNVSMNFSIDTAISSYVWSMLRTLEWLFQVLESLIQLNAFLTYYCKRHLIVISCLLLSIQTFVYKPMYIPYVHLIPRSSSTCTAYTTTYYRFFNVWNKLLKCTYIHLCLFHANVSNIQQSVTMLCNNLFIKEILMMFVSFRCIEGDLW